jgi:hypothetical protein
VKKLIQIAGRVLVRRSHNGVPGLEVEAWDDRGLLTKRIGAATTDASGRFTIELTSAAWRKLFRECDPDVLFRVHQNRQLVASTERDIRWSLRFPDEEVIIWLDADALAPAPNVPAGANAIRGHIRQADGSPLTDAIVRAFDKELRSESPLGEPARTDVQGAYEIQYSRRDTAESPDVVVRAYAADGSVVAESPVRFKAPPAVTIDVMVGGAVYPGASEYEVVAGAITPELDGVALAELTDDDVQFLSAETGQPVQRIEFLRAAAQRERETQTPAAAFYGLFRQGIPEDLTELLRTDPVQLTLALTRALERNLVPVAIGQQQASILDRLAKLALVDSIQNPQAGSSSIGSILGTVLPQADVQQKLVAAYAAHPGPVEDFWTQIRKDPAFGGDAAVDRLQNTLRVSLVVQNHLPMLQALEGHDVLQSPAALAQLDLAAWRKLVDQAGFPADMPGATDAEKASTYASLMAGMVEDAFPSAVAAARLARDQPAGSADMLTFFKNSPDFDLKRTNFEQYGAANPAALQGVGDVKNATNQLKSMQRVLRLTGRYDATQALLAGGLHSAHSIAQMAQSDFVGRYSQALGGFAAAETVYRKSQTTAAAALAIYGKYAAGVNNLKLPVTPDPPAQVQGIPDWESLFGSLDLCACDHCRSVYGPAAYLTDILAFLKNRASTVAKKSALDILYLRRADIGDIELSCANSDTPMPYVDLVNEVLESVISPTTCVPSRQRQTTWTADELAANPQYISAKKGGTDGAYEILAKAVYPWTLPFDLWTEEVRGDLSFLGVTRDQLMQAFQKPGGAPQPSDLDIATEYLGLTAFERTIVNRTAPGDPGIYWGQIVLNMAPLRQVTTLLERSGLAYSDLFQLLGADFIRAASPDNKFDIVSSDPHGLDTCDLTKLTVPEMNAEGLGRLHRFVRLWRKLGWTVHELDLAISTLQAADLDDPFLLKLAHVKRLKEMLTIPLVNLMAFWGNVETVTDSAGDPTLYSKLFLNKTVLNPPDAAFALAGSELAVIGKISEHVPAILAGLHLSAADFDTLAAAEIAGDALNIANLSKLYRYAALRRALGVSMKDFVALEALTGATVFPAGDPGRTLDFVNRVRKIRAGHLTAAKLNYVYRHITDSAHSAAPARDAITLLLKSLQDGLSKIADDTAMPANPTEDLLEKQLAAITDEAAAQKAVSFLDGVPANNAANQAFIQVNFPFLDPADAFANLLPAIPPAADDAKAAYRQAAAAYVLRGLLVYLKRTLSESLVKQTLGNALRLDNSVAELLLGSLLDARTAPGKHAMADYLALVGDGVSAAYFQNTNFTNLKLTRVEPGVNFTWGSSTPDPSIAAAGFSARFTAKVFAPFAEAYTFQIKTNGGVRLTVNGQVVINQAANALPADFQGTPIALLGAGQLYDLTLEYSTAASANAFLELLWSSPSTPQAAVSADQLFSGAGLTSFDPLVDSYTLLYKAALLVNAFKLTARELSYISGHPADFGFDVNAIPLSAGAFAPVLFAHYEQISTVIALRDNLPGGPRDLIDVFYLASTGAVLADVLDALADATGWDRDELGSITGATGFNLAAADFKNERWVAILDGCFTMRRRLGISSAKLLAWSVNAPDPAQAEDVKNAVKAQYEPAEWLGVAKPLRNDRRERQRAAVVAYLVVHPEKVPGAAWKDSSGLFDWFLTDVEMSPCQLTSRIKQAISSVQLFIQRCFMNLEPQVMLPAGDFQLWKWMRNYRVWEANRKIFLYPENWIDPALRDDKTPFFKDLENQLLQNELTKDNVEEAYLRYLESLHDVARLEVVGEYEHVESDWRSGTSVDDLHVIARTIGGNPRVYYYRRRTDAQVWTPWQKIDVDIDADHVIPVVYNRHLYVLWPVFTEKTDPAKIPGANQSGSEPTKHFEIQMAWSEYKRNKWSAKKVSDATFNTTGFLKTFAEVDQTQNAGFGLVIKTTDIKTHRVDAQQFQSAFAFKAMFTPDHDLWIGVYAKTEIADTHEFDETDTLLGATINDSRSLNVSINDDARCQLVGAFRAGCNGELSVSGVFDPGYPSSGRVTPPAGTDIFYNEFAEQRNQHTLQLPFEGSNQTALDATPTLFNLLYAHQDPEFTAQRPFFYQDARRTFFVTPVEVADWTWAQFQPGGVRISRVPFYAGIASQLAHVPDPGDPGPMMQRADPLPIAPSYPAQSVIAPQIEALTGAGPAIGPVGLGETISMTGGAEVAPQMALVPAAPRALALRADIAIGKAMYQGYDRASETFRWVREELLFQTFYHPFVCLFLRELNMGGLDSLLQRPLQISPGDFSDKALLNFKSEYKPRSIVATPYPVEDVDFSLSGAYAQYNWELFFHAPLMIAARLMQNQQFEDAQHWFHYIFDPTDRSTFASPQRFWRTRPFLEAAAGQPIQDLMKLLASSGDSQAKRDLQYQIKQWRLHPFMPHVIARLRISAYQKNVVMKYLDNLIAWGDQLFRADTIETINEATLLYVLAAEILGPRPPKIPKRTDVAPETFNELAPSLDDFSNALVAIENFIQPTPVADDIGEGNGQMPPMLPSTLYFCIPKNDQLLAYWETVADRLFKIRHCMNIEGQVQELPLFEPPIDPGLLVKAAAAGIDISSALNDMNAALPNYRFTMMVQKAVELCAEVRSLGGAVLSALEKRDVEALALLRSTNEVQLLKAARSVKAQQVEEAQRAIEALQKSREMVDLRHTFYANVEFMNDAEKAHIVLVGVSAILQAVSQLLELASSVASAVPDIEAGAAGWAGSPVATVKYGGSNVAAALTGAGRAVGILASLTSTAGQLTQTIGGYQRRSDDWALQASVSAKELEQYDKQILGAQIRQAVAQTELDNHDLQIENAKSVDEAMRDKFTNQDLYDWTVSQVSAIYFQCYQLAYNVAKRAEKAYQFERGNKDSFIQFGYWDSLKKGLLSGERLYYDLKRMEMAYLDQNKREYEITRHVSIALLDPLQLVTLKATGQCFVELHEELYDFDYPGQYMRRLKQVSISIPSVAGPYTNVNAKLTLLSNSIRITANAGPDYGRNRADDGSFLDDDRFVDDLGATQSVVTSTAQSDSGMFETNLRDERYLPFEGRGAISRWRIEMPQSTNRFDFNSISDVILHVRYTARDGGDTLKKAAMDAVVSAQPQDGFRLFSLRHEFPNEWRRFLFPPETQSGQSITLNLTPERFPMQQPGWKIQIAALDLYLSEIDNKAYQSGSPLAITVTASDASSVTATLKSADKDTGGMPHGPVSYDGDEKDPGAWTLGVSEADAAKLAAAFRKKITAANGDHQRLNADAIQDLWIVCRYLSSKA